MRQIILLLILLLCSISIHAQRFEYKGPDGQKLFYEVWKDYGVCVTSYAEPYSNKKVYKYKTVVIPENVTYNGKKYPVAGIGDHAFHGCMSLTHIQIPNSVIAIGESAFEGCEALTNIKLPNSLIGIWPRSFKNCKKLANIELPTNVKGISEEAFAGCNSLCDIVINSSVEFIGNKAFDGCRFKNVIIPNSVKKLGEGAFSGCFYLEKIHIPDSVKQIEGNTFYYCDRLNEVFIPNSVESIGEYAFAFCHSLKHITIPYSVVSIGKKAFWNCDHIETVKGLRDDINMDPDVFGENISYEKYINPFLYAFDSYVIPRIKAWQKKGDFESMEQYSKRITKENQTKKLNELTNEAIWDYVKKHDGSLQLGEYDSEYEIYPVISAYGNVYVKVSKAERQSFWENFKNAKLNDAKFSIINDSLKIKSLELTCNGKNYQSIQSSNEDAALAINIDLPEIVMPTSKDQKDMARASEEKNIDNTIDLNIPTVATNNTGTFAVIICNEKYQRVAPVPYAENDGKVFAEYCRKTLGLPDKNVRIYENATYGTILSAITDVRNIANAYNGNINIIFYYAGHGIPNESTKDAYLLPVDADGQQTEACYAISKLYKELGALGAKNVMIFMDACFSGALRGEGMLASARGVALKAKSESPQGNMVVFSAASSDETAYPYKEKGHGLFTYFLLKKLRESKGDCTLGELGEYIQTNVRQQAIVINRKSQTPSIVPSTNMVENWKEVKFK